MRLGAEKAEKQNHAHPNVVSSFPLTHTYVREMCTILPFCVNHIRKSTNTGNTKP